MRKEENLEPIEFDEFKIVKGSENRLKKMQIIGVMNNYKKIVEDIDSVSDISNKRKQECVNIVKKKVVAAFDNKKHIFGIWENVKPEITDEDVKKVVGINDKNFEEMKEVSNVILKHVVGVSDVLDLSLVLLGHIAYYVVIRDDENLRWERFKYVYLDSEFDY